MQFFFHRSLPTRPYRRVCVYFCNFFFTSLRYSCKYWIRNYSTHSVCLPATQLIYTQYIAHMPKKKKDFLVWILFHFISTFSVSLRYDRQTKHKHERFFFCFLSFVFPSNIYFTFYRHVRSFISLSLDLKCVNGKAKKKKKIKELICLNSPE